MSLMPDANQLLEEANHSESHNLAFTNNSSQMSWPWLADLLAAGNVQGLTNIVQCYKKVQEIMSRKFI